MQHAGQRTPLALIGLLAGALALAALPPVEPYRVIVARDLLETELTRRACARLGDSMGEANLDAHLRALIPGWRGASAELAALADTLAEYNELCAGNTAPTR